MGRKKRAAYFADASRLIIFISSFFNFKIFDNSFPYLRNAFFLSKKRF